MINFFSFSLFRKLIGNRNKGDIKILFMKFSHNSNRDIHKQRIDARGCIYSFK